MDVPEGPQFLKMVWDIEDTNERKTDELIPSLGSKAPKCWNEVGTVLSLLDRMASCWWGCRGGDHVVEYLCGRVVSNGRAALRLLRFGFYDEALSLCRSMGEVANLLHLFSKDDAALQGWKSASPKKRRTNFRPSDVRKKLEENDMPIFIGRDHYGLLSERSVHVHPHTKPQAYNILGIPSVSVHVQHGGLLVCLNEMVLPLAISSTFGAILIGLDKSVKDRIVASAENLLRYWGKATIENIDEYYDNVRRQIDWDAVFRKNDIESS